MTLKRINKELQEFENFPAKNFSVSLKDKNDKFHWKAIIIGPV